jgi:eukaryotic-like serine/threonine-protein kinase
MGDRSTVWLGHAGDESAQKNVAIKIYRDDAEASAIEAELRALSEAAHAHVVRVIDLTTSARAVPSLILERLSTTSLATVLRGREHLPPGEAVTALAPVIAAVRALHESGLSHGQLSAQHILFRQSGAPVLIGFGRASTALDEDVHALAMLVQRVLAHVATAEAHALNKWVASLAAPYTATALGDLSDRVFALGHPQPIQFAQPRLDQPPSPSGALVLSRTAHVHQAPAAVESSSHDQNPAHRGGFEWLPEGIRGPMGALLDHHSVRALLDRCRAIPKPLRLALATTIALVVVGLVVIPGGQQAQSAARTSEPTATTTTDAGTDVTDDAPTAVGPVVGDDPVAAFTVLWSTRRDCVMDLSVLFLDGVVQPGSAALDDDAALIRAIQGGSADGSLVADIPRDVVLVERHGDAALIAYSIGQESAPASVLLLKGEAGWRIRDYLDG